MLRRSNMRDLNVRIPVKNVMHVISQPADL